MISNTLKAVGISLLLGSASIASGNAVAADLNVMVPPAPPVPSGVDCQGPEVKTFPDVWLGHFTGGDSVYPGPGNKILLDWHDEKLCFPSRKMCTQWVSGLRQAYHRPTGYFTCLTIR